MPESQGVTVLLDYTIGFQISIVAESRNNGESDSNSVNKSGGFLQTTNTRNTALVVGVDGTSQTDSLCFSATAVMQRPYLRAFFGELGTHIITLYARLK